jgi:putative tryptophan/tyrosine transport system substrate-binding protein
VVNPDSVTTGPKLREMGNAARLLGRRLQVFNARNESEFEEALLSVVEHRLGAMVVTADTMFSNESAALGHAAARHGVPAMGAYRDFARAGGLMCYGSDLGDAYRRVGLCTARILKGEAPRDLPVTLSTKVEFVINAGAARALGLAIPSTLIALADEVVE